MKELLKKMRDNEYTESPSEKKERLKEGSEERLYIGRPSQTDEIVKLNSPFFEIAKRGKESYEYNKKPVKDFRRKELNELYSDPVKREDAGARVREIDKRERLDPQGAADRRRMIKSLMRQDKLNKAWKANKNWV